MVGAWWDGRRSGFQYQPSSSGDAGLFYRSLLSEECTSHVQEENAMLQTDWGNIALAVAALIGTLGWAVFVGESMMETKPPKFEPKMDEPQLKVFWPGRAPR